MLQSSKQSLIVLFLILLFFTRFYNLDHTARFTRDESSDLVRIHQYFVDKQITLVGPVDNTGTKVFGSLTYYMLMPFAALGNFEPVSPVWGTAFFGVLTAIFLLLMTQKINRNLTIFVGMLMLVFGPFLIASRWAWNPHLVPFWIILGLFFYFKEKTWSYFLAGVSFGLAFHNHYISFAATSVFIISVCVVKLLKKDYKKPALLVLGYILAFIPFLVFDLRHPPGLFFTRYLFNNETTGNLSQPFLNLLNKVNSNLINSFLTLSSGQPTEAIILGLTSLWLLFQDLKKRSLALIFALPFLAQVGVIAILNSFELRYILPGIPFFLTWLIYPRKGNLFLPKIALTVLIIGSLFTLLPNLTKPLLEPQPFVISDITQFLTKQNLNKANIATLQSPHQDPLGTIFRDMLNIRNNPIKKAPTEYDTSDRLYIISTSNEENIIQAKDILLNGFREIPIKKVYTVPNTKWGVFLINRVN